MDESKTDGYLMAIYRLQRSDRRVSPSAIAAERGVTSPTVTRTLQCLDEEELVDYERYRGARLTASGERRVLAALRRRRLLERFLTEEFGYDRSEVHDEADALEPHVSEQFVDRIAARLESQSVGPHDAPVALVESMARRERALQSLAQCEQGATVVVSAIEDQSLETLASLSKSGVVPGTTLDVLEPSSTGELTVEVSETGEQVSVSADVASAVSVVHVADEPTHDHRQHTEAR
ncbi:metal-dependent transcriptional regulator [Halomarina litorea]|uniref:metal-dependent transcriptional regulator n=1 Tax=Halomarina litorea TaxID=2961595 RepID=UPI002114A7E9|nr:metal-dependent transcriptional regulator [Halomarina sp. BCD28]